eukprot:CAMPEP_0184334508 /NCGR_PEP_ID=MMETSP1089-20130417/3272_1 /TAXON_ID=38269 ORGANISM="Gloeochaete wittrockiana, Strain SAG46.84" /NCGR_SAMPLE_ID=MMETSP1089 /ASSEMBLY_ACC=CAM_ASM_000445 /LENGTH=355 /DNA_ID=CAMNT_0026658791 /DNA_START=13 /DNA_END=1080 /DNA_ORIENTATION=+
MKVASCRLLVSVLVVLCVSSQALAWGSDGHKIVAQIAQTFVKPSTWSALQTQLGSLALADIATLPDSYDHDSQGSWSSHLHYVDNPLNATSFQMGPACLDTNGCVVSAIYNYTYILSKNTNPVPKGICSNNSTASNMKEPCALSFLTHYIGDVHQPLHVGYTSDAGGNGFSVTWYTSQTNLHSVWDSQIIYKYEDTVGNRTWQGMAQDLINELNKNPTLRTEWYNVTDPRVWANESFAYVRYSCYNLEPGSAFFYSKIIQDNVNHKTHERQAEATCSCPVLGDSYYGRNIPIVKERLMQAGIRLASILDLLYSKPVQAVPFDLQSFGNELALFIKLRATRNIAPINTKPRCALDH